MFFFSLAVQEILDIIISSKEKMISLLKKKYSHVYETLMTEHPVYLNYREFPNIRSIFLQYHRCAPIA